MLLSGFRKAFMNCEAGICNCQRSEKCTLLSVDFLFIFYSFNLSLIAINYQTIISNFIRFRNQIIFPIQAQ
jgi:accessory gene regulator protein AgrB